MLAAVVAVVAVDERVAVRVLAVVLRHRHLQLPRRLGPDHRLQDLREHSRVLHP